MANEPDGCASIFGLSILLAIGAALYWFFTTGHSAWGRATGAGGGAAGAVSCACTCAMIAGSVSAPLAEGAGRDAGAEGFPALSAAATWAKIAGSVSAPVPVRTGMAVFSRWSISAGSVTARGPAGLADAAIDAACGRGDAGAGATVPSRLTGCAFFSSQSTIAGSVMAGIISIPTRVPANEIQLRSCPSVNPRRRGVRRRGRRPARSGAAVQPRADEIAEIVLRSGGR
jgi:hypothetical protein